MRTRVRGWAAVVSLCVGVLGAMSGCGSGVVSSSSLAAGVPGDGSSGGQSRTLTGLVITPGIFTLDEGATQQFAATSSYSDGTTGPVLRDLQWSSSGAEASISQAGYLQTYGPGSVTVTATSGNVSGTAQLVIGSTTKVSASFMTSVAPVRGEDLAGSCTYEMLLLDSTRWVRGVWVIFERADSAGLWADPEVRAMAGQLRLALVYAHQCNAASYGDIQSDGRRGPARALTAALNQLATSSGHEEVGTANLALFGFSAAGVLSITTAESMPGRVLTVVTYAAGSAPIELRQLTPSAAFRAIPLLMLANARDALAGDSMTRVYFESGREAGAPWAFAVRPGVGHCCTITAKPMLLAWIGAMVPLREGATNTPVAIDEKAGIGGAYTCKADGVVDGRGYTDCLFTEARLVYGAADETMAWLPNPAVGEAWLRWTGF